jgi:hypothetical protein
VDETWGDLRVQFLTDCVHSQHTLTVRRFVRTAGDGAAWTHDPTAGNMQTHPAPGEGIRFSAALEDAIFDGEYGEPAPSVEAAIAAAPGWPCTEDDE